MPDDHNRSTDARLSPGNWGCTPELRGRGASDGWQQQRLQWHSHKRSQSRRGRQVTWKCPSCRNRNWQNRKCTACGWIWNPQGLEPTGHLPKTAAVAVEAVRGGQRGNLVVRGARHENPGRRPENRALTTLECHSGNTHAVRASPGRWRSGNSRSTVLSAIFFLGPLLRTHRHEMLAERLPLLLRRTPTTVGGEPCENLRRRSGENS